MKRSLGILIVAAVVSTVAVSCARKAKVIPVRKMEKIYREMFLADQWVADNATRRRKADTTWFYEPIFEKYGYDVEDYRKSVDHYLSDPKRYAEMLGRVVYDLQSEADAINRSIDKRAKMKARADSIAYAMKTYAPDDFVYYGDLFYMKSMTDRVQFRTNGKGVYSPVPVIEDTIFSGPELIIRDSIPDEALEPLRIPWKE